MIHDILWALASGLMLLALAAYYYVIFKPLQNEKALKQNEQKEMERIDRIIGKANREGAPEYNTSITNEEWEEMLRGD